MKTRVKFYSILLILVISTVFSYGFKTTSNHSFGSKTECTWCNGSGYCSGCEGAGKVDCLTCGGYGEITDQYNCKWDASQGTYICPKKTCNTCSGKGRVTCKSCNGTGRCKACHGTGEY